MEIKKVETIDPEQTFYDLFKINTRNLNSQTELHRIFGKGVAGGNSGNVDRRIDPMTSLISAPLLTIAG